MADKQKLLARLFSFMVQTGGTEGAPTFTQIENLNSGTLDWDESSADGTDFDSGGWNESYTSERGASLSLEGNYIEHTTAEAGPPVVALGDIPPGRKAIQDKAKLMAYDDQVRIRVLSSKTSKVIIDGFCRVGSAGPGGGGTNDMGGWAAELAFRGSPYKFVT